MAFPRRVPHSVAAPIELQGCSCALCHHPDKGTALGWALHSELCSLSFPTS